MTGSQVLVLGVTLWIGAGLVSSFVMARRGHNLFTWWYLSLVLGPLVIPLELAAVARARRAVTAGRRARPVPRTGNGPAVLAGLDGSQEALAALDTALHLLAPRVRWLTVATVVDYETSAGDELAGPDPSAAVLDAGVLLARARVPATPIDTARLRGRPDQALLRLAADGGYDLLVVGPTGRGTVTRLLGSTARGVVGAGAVPVFVGPRRTVGAVVRAPASATDLAVLGAPADAAVALDAFDVFDASVHRGAAAGYDTSTETGG